MSIHDTWYFKIYVESLLNPCPKENIYHKISFSFCKWNDESNLLAVLMLSMLIIWLIIFNLVTCELGERVFNQFEQFGSEVNQCDWSKLPIEMQRTYLIFLSDTQQSESIQSYAGISCTRDTFKQVLYLNKRFASAKSF